MKPADIPQAGSEPIGTELLCRVYAALSEVNELAANVRRADELLQGMCRVCCAQLQLQLARVGGIEDGRLKIVAAQGATDCLGQADPLLDPTHSQDLAPIAAVLRDGQPFVSNHVADDARAASPEPTQRASAHSRACLPLARNGHLALAIDLHARAPGRFDRQSTELLQRMCVNVGRALDRLDREAAADADYVALEERTRELEARLRGSAAALEAANRELESFSYSVSHDLRAPVRHVSGFARLLQDEAAAELDAQSRHYVEIIAMSARKLGKLIDDLLSYSRTARQPLIARSVPLGQLVRELIAELAADARDRSIEWTVAELPALHADPTLLRELLLRLLHNALKYTRTRPVARIAISATQESAATFAIEIRDNGVGFDMAYADKLFGVFQRLHREEEFDGTGIGLAICRRIVQRHGGRIWAEAIPGQGASFRFTIPQSEEDRGQTEDLADR